MIDARVDVRRLMVSTARQTLGRFVRIYCPRYVTFLLIILDDKNTRRPRHTLLPGCKTPPGWNTVTAHSSPLGRRKDQTGRALVLVTWRRTVGSRWRPVLESCTKVHKSAMVPLVRQAGCHVLLG
ncbi:hypothetical protein LSAT2_007344 [Lamellibrachia satsuma]|nr:hypothetical protein LSAT2_007344 [Lamellibrachia satsuma]